jgi:hypothetical protein
MTKCANCAVEAVYQYNLTDTFAQLYCPIHLPKFLRGKTSQSMLVSIIKPEPAPKKKKATVTPPAEDPAPTEE